MIKCIIDCSHYNTIDFNALVTDGVKAIIHKASQGMQMVDPTFAERKTAALSQGFLWGAYHFGIGAAGDRQAQHFLETAGNGGIQVLDFEDSPLGKDGQPLFPSMQVDHAEEFCAEIQEKTGKWPVVYADSSHVRKLLAESTMIPENCPLWIAQPGAAVPTQPATNWPTPWFLHQYDWHSRIVGETGEFDRDQFNGTEEELRAKWAALTV